jgi:transposase-like protein
LILKPPSVHRNGATPIIKTRGHFPNDEAAGKLIYLALRNIVKKWQNTSTVWRGAMTHFALLFGERFSLDES